MMGVTGWFFHNLLHSDFLKLDELPSSGHLRECRFNAALKQLPHYSDFPSLRKINLPLSCSKIMTK